MNERRLTSLGDFSFSEKEFLIYSAETIENIRDLEYFVESFWQLMHVICDGL